ncbi:MAG: endonuclease NucS [Cyanobacteriota bacterium]|nr:endonuclease NucS [Cyanobacteriota bacterium]
MPHFKREDLTTSGKKWNDKIRKESWKLLYVGGEIKFQSEENLEDYIEDNFEKLFPDLYLVRRQYTINRQRCDLLCRSKLSKQLVIIELKNEEDRGLISQLTRYRKALLIEKPFAEQIDYSLPVKLIAIAPTFHEDNYTDKEASKFEDDFYLWQFSIENQEAEGKFKLCGQTYDMDYPIFGLPGEILNTELNDGSLPTFTGNFVSRLDQPFRQNFEKLRLKFLSQPKVKEMFNN